ncbi:MAG: tetratricopeptide repeat protein [Caulobacteraceae bacterium]
MKNVSQSFLADLLNQATGFHRAGNLEGALQTYNRVVAVTPDHAGILCRRGHILAILGRSKRAIADFDRAIAVQPADAEAHAYRGVMMVQLDRLEEGLKSFDRAVALDPHNVHALASRGGVLVKLGRPQDALASLDLAVELQPGLIDAHFNRGVALTDLEQAYAARAAYERTVELAPDHVAALVNLGDIQLRLGAPAAAARAYGRAFALEPDQTELRLRQGVALSKIQRFDEAIACYQHVIAVKPDNAVAYNNTALALVELGRVQEALSNYDKAIVLAPEYAAAYFNRATAHTVVGDLQQAVADLEKALELDPEMPDVHGMRLFWAMCLCRWDGFDEQVADLARSTEAGERVTQPFRFLAVVDDGALQRTCAESYVRTNYSRAATASTLGPHPHGDKIRIGYFSADFHAHATMHLIAETLEAHDRRRFETTGFSFGHGAVIDPGDPWLRRAERAFDRFLDVRLRSDQEIAETARRLQIDIAVDLKGYTQASRPGVFIDRAAPVQVAFLGYPGAMGAPWVDYMVADDVLVPAGSRDFYSEKLIFLPGSYQPNCRTREVNSQPISRRDVGLPDAGFVYCCFNQSYKITPQVFARWMAILKRVEGAVLWLFSTHDEAVDTLKRQAQAHGVSMERLVFAARQPIEDHLNRLPLADLFLDTLPYNAHTTASDALRSGVPVLTCAGQSFASRVAASLLHAAGLPELVVGDLDVYEDLAVELAMQPERVAALRRRLELEVRTGPLFDGAAFARKLEAAYTVIHERCQSGLQPEDIRVPAGA